MISRRRLSPLGPDVSRIVWGAWRCLDGAESNTPEKLARIIAGCRDMGITTFDHADIYGGYAVEEVFGRALRLWGGDRSRIEIVTKCDIAIAHPSRPHNRVKHYDTSRGHILASVDRSLANLGTDYVDLLLIHRPDPFMDADETARGLEDVVDAGKVRFVGVSDHATSQMELLQSRLAIPLVTNQIELSVVRTDPLFDGTLDQAQQQRQSPMAWSPLGGGGLFSGASADGARLRACLGRIAAMQGHDDIGRVAIQWLLAHPAGVVPVLGTSRLDRLASQAAADGTMLDRQTWFEILEASRGVAVR